jgi:predicted nucleic acid-binding protein
VTTHFDTSALVSVYVTEVFSPIARREVALAGRVPFTPLHDLELGNALRLLHGRRLINAEELEQLLRQVAEDREAERLANAPVDIHHMFEHARELSEKARCSAALPQPRYSSREQRRCAGIDPLRQR